MVCLLVEMGSTYTEGDFYLAKVAPVEETATAHEAQQSVIKYVEINNRPVYEKNA